MDMDQDPESKMVLILSIPVLTIYQCFRFLAIMRWNHIWIPTPPDRGMPRSMYPTLHIFSHPICQEQGNVQKPERPTRIQEISCQGMDWHFGLCHDSCPDYPRFLFQRLCHPIIIDGKILECGWFSLCQQSFLRMPHATDRVHFSFRPTYLTTDQRHTFLHQQSPTPLPSSPWVEKSWAQWCHRFQFSRWRHRIQRFPK